MNTFNITLDLNKSNVTTPIRLRQGDLDGTTITALILDHGATADLTGLTARFVMELPGGEHYYRKDATVGEGSVTVVINEEQAASVTGRTTRAYFQLLDGETVRASTGSVTVDILPDALEGHTVPADYDSAIQVAIDALDDAVENIADTVEDVLEDHPEWTTTVQDGAVTDAKLYQGADGILARNERLMYRLDNLLTNALPEGDSATATDASKTPPAGLALYGRSTQNGTPTPSAPVAIQSVTGNVLPNNGTSQTVSGVTFTRNADGSVTCRGTNTSSGSVHYTFTDGRAQSTNKVTLPDGTYTLCVSIDGTGIRAEYLSLMNAGTVVAQNLFFLFGSGSSTKSMAGYDYDGMHCGFYIDSGVTVDATIRIAIYPGSTAYPYVPYGHAGLWAQRTSDASDYTVTPIPLDGHELRSLPDGTRDELTVGADGRVTLVQRVGWLDLADLTWSYNMSSGNNGTYLNTRGIPAHGYVNSEQAAQNSLCDTMQLRSLPWLATTTAPCVGFQSASYPDYIYVKPADASITSAATFLTWLTEHPTHVAYKLATPQTIDLGWTDAIPLCGPDLTAQSVPTAPFALTYERDLNMTLARLESAIATIA